MRKNHHLQLIGAACVDHTRQGLTVDYDPERKFDRWMDGQLEQLDARWARIYPTFDRSPSNRGVLLR